MADVIGTEQTQDGVAHVTEVDEETSHEHDPKHLLETGLLGKPKHGMQRVSDLAAKQDAFVGVKVSLETPDHLTDEEQSK